MSVQRYFLDSVTLLAILSRQKRSGTLSADHVHIPSVGGEISISMMVKHGVVRDCRITREQRIILQGKSAYHVVETLSALEWSWNPLSTSSAPLFPPLPVASPTEKSGADYPQQTARVQNKELLQWLPHRHRQVLSLCNGTRSLDKIAAMLSISPQALPPLIGDLKRWGCIRFRQEF